MTGKPIKGYQREANLIERWLAIFETGWPMSASALKPPPIISGEMLFLSEKSETT
ncbi:MAG: hypothetical protein H0X47_09375 [Nitrospirales bacterium]|nr:hypothetical protein [Nitrospirales bacterium]